MRLTIAENSEHVVRGDATIDLLGLFRRMGAICQMRRVVIVRDRKNQRPWVAVDCDSGSLMLRLANRDQLEDVCSRLGWQIAGTQAVPRIGADLFTVERST